MESLSTAAAWRDLSEGGFPEFVDTFSHPSFRIDWVHRWEVADVRWDWASSWLNDRFCSDIVLLSTVVRRNWVCVYVVGHLRLWLAKCKIIDSVFALITCFFRRWWLMLLGGIFCMCCGFGYIGECCVLLLWNDVAIVPKAQSSCLLWFWMNAECCFSASLASSSSVPTYNIGNKPWGKLT